MAAACEAGSLARKGGEVSHKDEQTLIEWRNHPLFDPNHPPCVVAFDHFVAEEPSLWMRWKRLLYTIRNL